MITFNEWVKDTDISQGASMENDDGPDLIESQMSQMVDRVNGLLFNIPHEQKTQLLNKFISQLNDRVNNGI